MMRKISVLHQNLGGIEKSIPSTLEIFLGLRPREISRVSGNLSGVGDGFPNTSLVLVEHGDSVQLGKGGATLLGWKPQFAM